jgi:FkbM family methyltransferase
MYLINPKQKFEKIDNNSFFISDYKWGIHQFNNGMFENTLINWCRNELCKDSSKNFVDIGAFIGQWSWTIAPNVNHVYSFEPNNHIFNLLCANVALKNLSDKISPINIGLSNENIDNITYYHRFGFNHGCGGFLKINETSDNNTDITNIFKFNLKRLDDLNIENIGFIKIDVEGYEKNVLQGALQTLKNNDYPTICLESWDENHGPGGENSIQLRKELFTFIEESLPQYKILTMTVPEQFLLVKK